jgi:UDP-N-acetylglucosamine 2-epimerase (non-hydrolysing)
LQQEGIPEKKITVSGNTVIDALNLGMKKIDKKQYASISRIKKLLDFPSKPFILATVHRRENQGEKLKNICEALQLMATSFGINIIIPVHPNPLISDVLNSTLRGVENIKLIEPVPYPGFLWLMKNCQLIVTDSGGIQEEATGIGKNVVLLRETTERKEAIEKGFVFKAGTDPEKILRMTKSLLDKKSDPGKKDIFGAGDAAENIIDFIKKLH